MINSKPVTCSSCNLKVHPKDIRSHPTLFTQVCSCCYIGYKQVGDLSQYRGGVETDGQDNFCRWCLDGGELILCHDVKCRNGFCDSCIIRILGSSKYSTIKNNSNYEWYCFVCDSAQIDPKIKRPVARVKPKESVRALAPEIDDASQAVSSADHEYAKGKRQMKPGTKPLAKPETETQRESQMDSQIESGTDSQTEPGSDFQTDPGTNSQTDPGTDSQAELATGSRADPQTSPVTKQQKDSQMVCQAELLTEPEPKAQEHPQTDLQAEPLTKPQEEPQPEFQEEPQPDMQLEPQPELQKEPQPVLQLGPRPVLETEHQPALRTDPRPVLQKDPQPVLQTDCPTKPQLQPQTVSTAKLQTEPQTTPSTELLTRPQAKRKLPLSFGIFSTSAMCTQSREGTKKLKQSTDLEANSTKEGFADSRPTFIPTKPKEVPIQTTAGPKPADILSQPKEILNVETPSKANSIDIDALDQELQLSDDDSDFVDANGSLENLKEPINTEATTKTNAQPVASVANIIDVEMSDMDIVESLEAHTSKIQEQEKTKQLDNVSRWALKDAILLKGRLDVHLKALQDTSNNFSEDRFRDEPKGIFGWASNLETFLSESESIIGRCQHLLKYVPQLKKM